MDFYDAYTIMAHQHFLANELVKAYMTYAAALDLAETRSRIHHERKQWRVKHRWDARTHHVEMCMDALIDEARRQTRELAETAFHTIMFRAEAAHGGTN